MTTLFTITDDLFFANESSGRKYVFGLLSCTNPYSAGGELISTAAYFKQKALGGKVVYIDPGVPIALAGVGATGTFRANTASYTGMLFQLFNAGLSATANAGLFVDNTTGNISGLSVGLQLMGY